jgi:hypothetical protein
MGLIGESGRPRFPVTEEIADSNSAGAASRSEAHVEERRSPKPKVACSNHVTPAMRGWPTGKAVGFQPTNKEFDSPIPLHF